MYVGTQDNIELGRTCIGPIAIRTNSISISALVFPVWGAAFSVFAEFCRHETTGCGYHCPLWRLSLYAWFPCMTLLTARRRANGKSDDDSDAIYGRGAGNFVSGTCGSPYQKNRKIKKREEQN